MYAIFRMDEKGEGRFVGHTQVMPECGKEVTIEYPPLKVLGKKVLFLEPKVIPELVFPGDREENQKPTTYLAKKDKRRYMLYKI